MRKAERPASTVLQFVEAHQISRTLFYELMRQGKGPRTMKLGRRTLISAEAAAEWRARMEQETAKAAA
jgi:predicted DNA-binding transcriptional regulator AlpA